MRDPASCDRRDRVSPTHARLVALHGQPGWVAALTPLSVDGMIVAASTTLLCESRSGDRGGVLPWALLVIGSIARLTANVAVAEPTVTERVIAAWPSFALLGSYELLMRRSATKRLSARGNVAKSLQPGRSEPAAVAQPSALTERQARQISGEDGRRQAWQWALANRRDDGSLSKPADLHFRERNPPRRQRSSPACFVAPARSAWPVRARPTLRTLRALASTRRNQGDRIH